MPDYRELCTPFRLEPRASERVSPRLSKRRNRSWRESPRNRVMTQGLAGHSSANVTRHHLQGIHFPASKDGLLLRARDNGAGQDTIEVLESFPEGIEFKTLADVMRACGQADHVPQTRIIE